jgi:hypothetical protein
MNTFLATLRTGETCRVSAGTIRTAEKRAVAVFALQLRGDPSQITVWKIRQL